jgi:hypothetical protein
VAGYYRRLGTRWDWLNSSTRTNREAIEIEGAGRGAWNVEWEEGGGEDRIGRSDQKWLEIGDWMSTVMMMWLEVGGGLIYKRRGQRRSVGVLASQASLRSDWIWMDFVNVGWNFCLQLRKDSGNIFVSLASLTQEWILWTLEGDEHAPGFGGLNSSARPSNHARAAEIWDGDHFYLFN